MTQVTGLELRLPSPLEEVHDERLAARGVRLLLKRDDLINPDIPGNKWRKLKYNLEDAKASGARTLLTFGGAYSNHIRAVAAAGHYFDFKTVGIIRGEQHLPLNPTLDYAVRHGMTIDYLDRTTYRTKNSPELIDSLRRKFGDFFLIPEGGSNAAAVRGAAEIAAELTVDYDVVCCPCGTGGTLAGLAAGLPSGKRAIGFAALRGASFLNDDVRRLQTEYGHVTDNWTIELDYHFGGFARRTQALNEFISEFRHRYSVELEWVYVAKMLIGVFEMVQQRRIDDGTTVVVLVTGPALS